MLYTFFFLSALKIFFYVCCKDFVFHLIFFKAQKNSEALVHTEKTKDLGLLINFISDVYGFSQGSLLK